MSDSASLLGSYRPLNTPLHRLNGLVKLLLLIALMVIIFLPYGNSEVSNDPYATDMIIGGAILILINILIILSKISVINIFKAILKMWFLIAFLILLNLFFYRPGSSFMNKDVLFTIGDYPVYETGLWFAGYVIERIILTVMSTMVITSVTSPMELSRSFELLLYPLKLIKVPVTSFSMMMSLALRFIPLFASEAKRIQRAQASRGLDVQNGTLREKFKSLFSLTIPLIVISMTDAINSAEAMEARGYDPRAERTRYTQNRFRATDAIWIGVILLVLAGMLFLSLYRRDGLRIEII